MILTLILTLSLTLIVMESRYVSYYAKGVVFMTSIGARHVKDVTYGSTNTTTTTKMSNSEGRVVWLRAGIYEKLFHLDDIMSKQIIPLIDARCLTWR